MEWLSRTRVTPITCAKIGPPPPCSTFGEETCLQLLDLMMEWLPGGWDTCDANHMCKSWALSFSSPAFGESSKLSRLTGPGVEGTCEPIMSDMSCEAQIACAKKL